MITNAYTRYVPKRSLVVPGYLEWLLLSFDLEKRFKPYYSGLRNTIPKEILGATRVSLPPLAEQSAIASYLDRETAQIDTLIAKQEQLISTLRERRGALTVALATGGTDSGCKVIETGLSWLQHRPAHWGIKPMYTLGSPVKSKNAYGQETNLLSLSYGRIVPKDINSADGLLPESFDTYQVVERDDEIFRFTDLQNDQRSLRSGLVRERGIITSAYLAFRPVGIYPQYFDYLMRAYDLLKVFYAMGSGLRQSLNYDEVKKLPVLVPPLDEQIRIVNQLETRLQSIDHLVLRVQSAVDLLRERKQALISAAVTGKIDVRG
jgi:type I restriction enzyme S subunit